MPPRFVLDPSAERLEGPAVLDLAYPIVQDHETPEPVLAALREAAGKVGRYPHREREVREALAAYVGAAPAEILPTVGGNGALDLLGRTFFAGRRVVVPLPAFWQLADAPARYGARLSFPDLGAPDAAERILAAFEEADGIVLCSPHNPTGRRLEDGLLERLLHEARGRPVVVDESYADLDGLSVRSTPHPDLIAVRGFKTFLIPGVRTGYLVADAARIEALREIRPPFESNVFAEAAVLAVLAEIESIRAIWRQVRADLRFFEAGLAALGGEVHPSSTLFACWRHPRACDIGRALAAMRIYAIFADRPVIQGMPADLLRMTARRREIVEAVLALLGRILERLPPLPAGGEPPLG